MREMIDITSDTKLIRVLCEKRFLSSMAFSAYEVVRVACLAGYSKSNDPPKVAIKFHKCYQIPKSSHPPLPENNDPTKEATSKVISFFARNRGNDSRSNKRYQTDPRFISNDYNDLWHSYSKNKYITLKVQYIFLKKYSYLLWTTSTAHISATRK